MVRYGSYAAAAAAAIPLQGNALQEKHIYQYSSIMNCGDTDMKYVLLFGIILFLSLSCTALAGLQLSGEGGRAVLESLAAEMQQNANATNHNSTSENSTNANASIQEDLWSWGKIPIGHKLNGSGVLEEMPNQNDPLVVVPPHGGIP